MGREADDVVRIAKKLDKMVAKKSSSGALDLLKELKNIPMTLEVLQSTRVGMSVNALRKQSCDEEVTTLAKSLIKSWKKLLDGADGNKTTEKRRDLQATTPPPGQDSMDGEEESSSSGSMRTNAPLTPTSPRNLSFPPAPVTSDSVRNKCRGLISQALQTNGDFHIFGADCEGMSSLIEEYILFFLGVAP
uniref:transcription elongation factor A protein 1-like n=1 Tax=Myxine glutinosa TaxID=7769 RepID=UPI00358F424B